MSFDYWNRKYRRKGLIWGKAPTTGVKVFAEHLRARGKTRVLEVGCGYGRDSAYLAEKGCLVTGVDSSEAAVELAREIWKELPAVFIQGKGEALEFEDRSFEGVWSSNFLHLFRREKRGTIMEEMKRILDKGGLLGFSVASTRDPGYRRGEGEVLGPRTLVVEGKVMHFFDEEEVLDTMKGFNILEAKEVWEAEKHASGAIHRHVNWAVVGEKR